MKNDQAQKTTSELAATQKATRTEPLSLRV